MFIFGCTGSLLLRAGPLQLRRVGATLHRGAWASHRGVLSRCGARAPGTRASVVAAHGLSCSAACGIFPDQGSNPCPLHWQADSQPWRHQGSPVLLFLITTFKYDVANPPHLCLNDILGRFYDLTTKTQFSLV